MPPRPMLMQRATLTHCSHQIKASQGELARCTLIRFVSMHKAGMDAEAQATSRRADLESQCADLWQIGICGLDSAIL